MISVIVPNLNEANVLPFFMRSIYQQTLRDFELIIVDGGSTDKSREIIDRYRSSVNIIGFIDFTKNLGYIRNRGARAARGHLLFFTNSDAILPRSILSDISKIFNDATIQALSGKTKPLNGGILCNAGYFCFDLIRIVMANYLAKFSPSGNFLVIRSELFWKLGGFAELRVNEDGHLGQKISQHCRAHGQKARFDKSLYTGHFVKRWANPLRGLRFYTYVFGNFHPFLERILKPFERRAGAKFAEPK